VLLKGHPSSQPLLGEFRAHNLLSLVLNPNHVCSASLTLSDWRLGAWTVDTSNQCLVHLPDCCYTELPKACNYEWDLWLRASSGSSGLAPSPRDHLLLPTSFLQNSLHIAMDARGPSTSPTSVVAAARPADNTPRGPAIDVSNSGGGHCRTRRQHPQGACHRRLQLRWWPLPDLPIAPPGSPPSTSPTLVVAIAGPTDSTH
jgi:hypothetical protein